MLFFLVRVHRKMAYHHTTVVMNQPTPVVTGNPKLLGSVHGVRDWSSGLFSCCEDCMANIKTCCCIECVLCELSIRTGECCLMPWFVPGGIITLRTSIRRLGGISGSICKDYIAISCCPAFAICQMLRELDDMGL